MPERNLKAQDNPTRQERDGTEDGGREGKVNGEGQPCL